MIVSYVTLNELIRPDAVEVAGLSHIIKLATNALNESFI